VLRVVDVGRREVVPHEPADRRLHAGAHTSPFRSCNPGQPSLPTRPPLPKCELSRRRSRSAGSPRNVSRRLGPRRFHPTPRSPFVLRISIVALAAVVAVASAAASPSRPSLFAAPQTQHAGLAVE